jgi:hypothetical protein
MSEPGAGVPDLAAQPPVLAGPSGGLLAELTRWAATARVEEAVAARSRERWLRRQAEEEATLAGVLCDLAERRIPVVVQTSSGRRHRGTVGAVGRDFCVLVVGDGRELLVALAAVSVLRPEPGARPPIGDRALTVELGLLDALTHLCGERARVVAVTSAGETLAGEIRSVGQDVVALALDGHRAPTAYLPAQAIAEVSLT